MLLLSWEARGGAAACCHGEAPGLPVFPTICSAILVVLLVAAFVRRFNRKSTIINKNMTKEYTIKGMNCPHCQATVTRTIGNVPGVTHVDVDLSTGKAVVEGTHTTANVVAAVRAAGFDAAE